MRQQWFPCLSNSAADSLECIFSPNVTRESLVSPKTQPRQSWHPVSGRSPTGFPLHISCGPRAWLLRHSLVISLLGLHHYELLDHRPVGLSFFGEPPFWSGFRRNLSLLDLFFQGSSPDGSMGCAFDRTSGWAPGGHAGLRRGRGPGQGLRLPQRLGHGQRGGARLGRPAGSLVFRANGKRGNSLET